MKGEDILDGRCVTAMIGARIRPPHDNGRRHLREGVRAMIGAPVQTAHNNGRRHLREGVWATIGAQVQNALEPM
jgi:hypothetical protein